MEEVRLTVTQPCADILEFLANSLPALPLNLLRRLVAHGGVEVDGRRVDHTFVPQPGQAVVLSLPETPIVRYSPQKMDIEVLFENADVLAINKPAGLGVIPDPVTFDAPLLNGLLYYVRNESPWRCERVHVVHRLDKETSGALVVARNVRAARHLSDRFQRREVVKHYLAVVQGEVAGEEGEVDLPIAQGRRGRMRLRGRRGRPAFSRWRVLERFRAFTLVEVQPLTGRQHQVRLHLAGIGHPLAVDRLYGGSEALFLSRVKPGYRPKRDRPEPPLMARLTLHALRLEVDLPDGERLAVEAPLPRDFERLLATLRRYAPRR
jgi:RluA family pseudouridine synthase